MTAQVEAIKWDDLPDMATVEETRRFLRCSDQSCRKFARENGIYLKVSGNARIPKESLRQVLFENDEEPEDSDVLEFEADQ